MTQVTVKLRGAVSDWDGIRGNIKATPLDHMVLLKI